MNPRNDGITLASQCVGRALCRPDARCMVEEIMAHRGRQFHPEVADAFLAIEVRGELITEPLPGGPG